MGVPAEVVHSLRILGLPSDATADDVRSAFRRLARTYHPDVAGRHYSRKFEQITKAYAILKELPQEESSNETARPPKSASQNDVGRWFSFGGTLSRTFDWYRTKQERPGTEKETLRRAAEDAFKKTLIENEARVDAILNRGERMLEGLLSRRERETRRVGTKGLVLRLASGNCQVRHLALANLASLTSLGELANKPEIFETLSDSLQKWSIDDKTARLVSALPLTPDNHRRLACGLAVRASVMPDALISHLLRLYDSHAADRELLETYLSHAGASGIALILRKWPHGTFVSESTLRRLISHEDESVLVAVLSTMKQRSVPCPESALGRLSTHLSHPNVAVRVWAKALLPASKR